MAQQILNVDDGLYDNPLVKDEVLKGAFKVWEKGEVEINKKNVEMGNLGLSEAEENDLLAFLLTLTDAQYEHLIP